jgi:hypothetical protein
MRVERRDIPCPNPYNDVVIVDRIISEIRPNNSSEFVFPDVVFDLFANGSLCCWSVGVHELSIVVSTCYPEDIVEIFDESLWGRVQTFTVD